VPLPFTGSPFVPVRAVEHYLLPVRDGNPPAYWEAEGGYAEASANLVIHLEMGYSRERLRTMVRQFVADGWSYSGSGEGSELEKYGREASAELRQNPMP
jgi:hypothetical protein